MVVQLGTSNLEEIMDTKQLGERERQVNVEEGKPRCYKCDQRVTSGPSVSLLLRKQ